MYMESVIHTHTYHRRHTESAYIQIMYCNNLCGARSASRFRESGVAGHFQTQSPSTLSVHL